MMHYRTRVWLKPFIIILDIIGNIFFNFLKNTPVPNNKTLNIAVLRFEYFGDLLLSFPFFQNLKQNYLDSKVTVFCRTSNKFLIEQNPYIDEIITLNTPWFSRGDKDGYWEIINYAFKNRNKFDIIFDLHPDPRNILFARITGKYTVGFGTRGLGFLLNKVVDLIPDKPIILRYLDQITAIGGRITTTRSELFFKEEDVKHVNDLLTNNKVDINNPIICINPGTSCQSKMWPEEHFANLINNILSQHQNINVILIDAKNNKSINKIVANINNKKRFFNFSELCSIMQFIELIKLSVLYIGVDSFGNHAAAAVDTPVVDIHSGITMGQELLPFTDKKIVIQKNIDCAGCGKEVCINNICMSEITPEEVLNGVNTLLNKDI